MDTKKRTPRIEQNLRCTRWLVGPLWSDHDGMECTSLSTVRRIELDGGPVGYFCQHPGEGHHCRQVAQRAHARLFWGIASLDEGELAPLAVFLGVRSSFRGGLHIHELPFVLCVIGRRTVVRNPKL